MHSSVAVLIINAAREVLYHQRNDIKYWGLPGGIVESGESPEEAAVREVKEETGLDVVISRKMAEYKRPQVPGGEDRLHVFLATPVAGALYPSNNETAALRWAAIGSHPKPSNPYLLFYHHDYLLNQPGVISRTLTLTWLWVLWMRILSAVRMIIIGAHH